MSFGFGPWRIAGYSTDPVLHSRRVTRGSCGQEGGELQFHIRSDGPQTNILHSWL